MDRFVFFGRSHFQYNGFDSMKILLNDVIHDHNFYYVDTNSDGAFQWLNYFYLDRVGTSIKKRIGVPMRNIAYRSYLQHDKVLNREDTIYFFFVRSEPWFWGKDGFLQFLRNHYPNAKLVYLLLNVNRYLNIDFDSFSPNFDLVITIDEGDAKRYGLEFHPFFYSAVDIENDDLEESDVLFVGNAKDRLEEIHNLYAILTQNGFKCDFHIVGVERQDQKYEGRITYNRPMNYDEVVCRVKKTKVLLELMQQGQTCGTLREHEAVLYRKKLLTNNSYIKNRNFYSRDNVSVFERVDEIDIAWLKSQVNLPANYSGQEELSPRAFLHYVQEKLSKGSISS